MRRQQGFTLIELMIVVGIIAILAAFAVPTYLRYGIRARRADGQQTLLRIANAQERYYSTNNKYGALTDIGYTNPTLSDKQYYSVTVASATTTFTATAAPVAGGAQAKDDCKSLTIDNTGQKKQTGSTTNGSCW